ACRTWPGSAIWSSSSDSATTRTPRTAWTPRSRDAIPAPSAAPAGPGGARLGGPPSGPAQAPAAIAAFDETVAGQPAQAAQHGVEVHARLDRDRRGSRAAPSRQRVEYPGAVRVEVIAGSRAAGVRIRPWRSARTAAGRQRIQTAAGGQRIQAAAGRQRVRGAERR